MYVYNKNLDAIPYPSKGTGKRMSNYHNECINTTRMATARFAFK